MGDIQASTSFVSSQILFDLGTCTFLLNCLDWTLGCFVEYLLSGLRFGFDTMESTLELPIIECKNLLSAVRDPETVDSLIEQEVQKGYRPESKYSTKCLSGCF
jgi:uncharacterized membrane protein